MRVRTVASGVALAALVGTAVPIAMSGSAGATSTAPPTITKCTPGTATIGKLVTVVGTGLTGATALKIDGKAVAMPFKKDSGKKLTGTVPAGIGVKNPDTVKVTTPNGTTTGTCTFKKAKKHSKK